MKTDPMDYSAYWGKAGKGARGQEMLCRVALELFDELADREDAAFTDMKRIVGARQKLRRQLNGKKLREVLHLTDRRKEKAA